MVVIQIESALQTIWTAYKNKQLAAQRVEELQTNTCQYFYKDSTARCAIGQLIPFWYKNLFMRGRSQANTVRVTAMSDKFATEKDLVFLSAPKEIVEELQLIQSLHDAWMAGLEGEDRYQRNQQDEEIFKRQLQQLAVKHGISLT